MVTLTLTEIAELVGGRTCGDGQTVVTGANTLRDARPGDLTFVDCAPLLKQFAGSPAAAALVEESVETPARPCVVVKNVHAAFAKVVARFLPPLVDRTVGVSPAAHVASSARLGRDVVVHPGAVIGEDVAIGDRSVIHPGVVVMAGCRVGCDAVLFPNVVLYERTVLGDRVVLHAGAVLGAYGFGYEFANGRHTRSAQLGNVEVGSDVEIGAGTTVDRGTYGPTVIGEGTKVDNLVMIAHNCRIGRHNILCSQVGIAGSCTTGDYVVLAGQVGLRDHITIGDRVQVAATAGVIGDIPSDSVWGGTPAGPIREQKQMVISLTRLPALRKEVAAMKRTLEELCRTVGVSADAALEAEAA